MRKTLLILLLSSSIPVLAGESHGIKIDQVGYLPSAAKVAVVTSPLADKTFRVVDSGTGETVFGGKLSTPREDKDSGDAVRSADFTPVTVHGTYRLVLDSGEESYPFRIAPDAFRDALYLSMRSFYGQRCGTKVDLGPRFKGYKHGPCHHKDVAYHASTGKKGKVSAGGGWHDAGDYGKYVVNSGLSTATLLWAWEWYGDRLKDLDLDIPESGDAVPDFLDEIRWNLEWMLVMQDADGGVFHKMTSERFGGFTMPEDDDAGPHFVIGSGKKPYKNTTATADFAAVMAVAARVFVPFSKEDSGRYLAAARRAFDWAVEHPDAGFSNPPGVRTGGYGDGHFQDELLWAAAEIYRTTGEAPYNRYFLEHLPKERPWVKDDDPQAWPNVLNPALWAYAQTSVKGADPKTRKRIRKDTVRAAKTIVKRNGGNGYRHSLTSGNYIWGSNAVALNYSLLLLMADRFDPQREFRDAAWDDLHYVLGRNTFCVSWVTQVGGNPFHHPHHRPSGADKNEEPWPGLLSGGPNRGRQDVVLRRLPLDTPPAACWADDQGSYAGNEIAINWNAPLVFVLASTLP